MGERLHPQRLSQGVSPGVELCRLVDHGKLHVRHGLSAWVNLSSIEQWNSTEINGRFQGVLVQNSDLPEDYYVSMAFRGNRPDTYSIWNYKIRQI